MPTTRRTIFKRLAGGRWRRTVPLPDRVVAVLKAAKARQAAERLALGHDGGAWAYVVSNEVGEPYSPAVPSR